MNIHVAIIFKLPLLLTPLVYITTKYLAKLYEIMEVFYIDVILILAAYWCYITVNCVYWAHIHHHQIRQQCNGLFSATSWNFPFIKVMSGFWNALEEINVMSTVAYLNEIVSELQVSSWSGQALSHTFHIYSDPWEFECPPSTQCQAT